MARNPFEQLRDAVVEPRQAFEDIITLILKSLFPESRRVRIYCGDGGIDAYTGTLGKDGEADVYQVKYFPDPWRDSQKQQIREAYQRARHSKHYQLRTWTLCVPVRLTKGDLGWWDSWRAEQDRPIELMDGDDLTQSLRDERCAAARQQLDQWGVMGVQGAGPRFIVSAVIGAKDHRGTTCVYVRIVNGGDLSARNMKVVVSHSETACVAQQANEGWIECGGGVLNPRQLRLKHTLNPGEDTTVMGIPVWERTPFPLSIAITITAEDCKQSKLKCKLSAEQIGEGKPVAFREEP
jgi:hypothetical protein